MLRTVIVLAFAWAAAVVCAVGGLNPAPAHADEPAATMSSADADRHLATGLQLYADEKYQAAIAEFTSGYAIEPRREFLYALGQAERLSGDCASAIIYYRRFLSRNPPERQQQATWEHLRQCEQAVASGPAASRPAPARSSKPVAPPAVVNRRPWYRDTPGNVLAASGLTVLVAGGGFLLAAEAAADDALEAASYDEFDRKARQVGNRRAVGIGLSLTGAALIGGAIYRYLSRGDGTEVRLAPTAGGVAVGWGGRF